MSYSCEKTYQSPLIIKSEKFSKVVKNFIKVHNENRVSILTTYKDAFNISTFEYADKVWSLLETGQIWLKYNIVFIKLLLDDYLNGYWV